MNIDLDNLKKQLKKLPVTFNIKGLEKFSQNGVTNQIVILEYENSEFILLKGKKNVILGWDTDKCHLGTNVILEFKRDYEEGLAYYQAQYEEIKQDYEQQIQAAVSDQEKEQLRLAMAEDLEYSKENMKLTWEEYCNKLKEYVKENTSPLRTVDIGAMIVERDSCYIPNDLSYHEFIKNPDKITYPPFTIPTEDEWEYLCGGGTRTFFRWGDSLDIPAIYAEQENIFYNYNMHGLHIAYDPYRLELIASERYVKGGDGGCSLCGGDGALYVAPCFSSFYRNKFGTIESLSKNFYTYRRIIRLSNWDISREPD
ncbi:MAG: hypothetical protein H6Q73_2750 [Firmicutes bacterium]|nr:hypothetical protein [Bacillota bacterium]